MADVAISTVGICLFGVRGFHLFFVGEGEEALILKQVRTLGYMPGNTSTCPEKQLFDLIIGKRVVDDSDESET